MLANIPIILDKCSACILAIVSPDDITNSAKKERFIDNPKINKGSCSWMKRKGYSYQRIEF
jgi:hypothetical protein